MASGTARSTAPQQESQASSRSECIALRWVWPQSGVLPLVGRERVGIGRAEDSDWILAGSDASRQHAEFYRDGPLWLVRDLGSRNGTYVDGKRITRAPIGDRTVIRAGGSVAVVSVGSEEALATLSLREMSPGFFAGSSLRQVLEQSERMAQSELPIIIEGETGTGKERVARWIHEMSGRAGPFTALNCAALPDGLAEGELFGYRKGAFTGAGQSSPGLLRAAQGGTLLLDEILDLPASLQAKLLRAIEQREVTPLGESAPVSIDVRLLAASQAPLENAVKSGSFRGDLWARLDGYTLRIPPLRERVEDIVPLFREFLARDCGSHPPEVESRLVEALCLYEWPYNVRQLEFTTRRLAIAHGHEAVLRRSHLPTRLAEGTAKKQDGAPAATPGPVDEYENFIGLLRTHGGVVARAAQAAGISRMRAYRLMKDRDFDLESARVKTEE